MRGIAWYSSLGLFGERLYYRMNLSNLPGYISNPLLPPRRTSCSFPRPFVIGTRARRFRGNILNGYLAYHADTAILTRRIISYERSILYRDVIIESREIDHANDEQGRDSEVKREKAEGNDTREYLFVSDTSVFLSFILDCSSSLSAFSPPCRDGFLHDRTCVCVCVHVRDELYISLVNHFILMEGIRRL